MHVDQIAEALRHTIETTRETDKPVDTVIASTAHVPSFEISKLYDVNFRSVAHPDLPILSHRSTAFQEPSNIAFVALAGEPKTTVILTFSRELVETIKAAQLS